MRENARIDTVLHILRNPFGKSTGEIRQARLDAADWIEKNITAQAHSDEKQLQPVKNDDNVPEREAIRQKIIRHRAVLLASMRNVKSLLHYNDACRGEATKLIDKAWEETRL